MLLPDTVTIIGGEFARAGKDRFKTHFDTAAG
jgi:hypothetical protein